MDEEMTLIRFGKSDVKLYGKTIGGISRTDNRPLDDSDPWRALVLLERENGGWFIVGLAGNSRGDYHAIEKPAITSPPIYADEAKSEEDAQQMMIDRVMKWLEWSPLSKALAEKMGWQVTSEHR